MRPSIRSTSRWPVAAAVSAFVLVAAGPAAAEDAPDDRPASPDDQRLFQQALVHYDTAEYEQAIELFRTVYERTRMPALLFNMAQAYRLKGDCRRAVDLYGQFVRLDPKSPDRERAMARLVALGTCQPAAAESPAPAIALPVRSPSPTAAPPVVSHERREMRAPQHSRARTAAIVLGAVGLGLSAAAGYFAWRAHDDATQIGEVFDRGGPWDDGASDLEADGRAARSTARTLLGAAAVSIVAGAIFYVYDRRSERAP